MRLSPFPARGKVVEAAAATGTDRSWLYRRARELGIEFRAARERGKEAGRHAKPGEGTAGLEG